MVGSDDRLHSRRSRRRRHHFQVAVHLSAVAGREDRRFATPGQADQITQGLRQTFGGNATRSRMSTGAVDD